MILSLQLPDEIARQLRLDGPSGSQRALEELALEGYRRGDISRGQLSELLGHSVWETEALLKANGCGLGLTSEEVEADAQQLRDFLKR